MRGKRMEIAERGAEQKTFTDRTVHVPVPRTGTRTEVASLHYSRFVLHFQFTSKIN